jgi:hypothetical protein
MNEENSDSLSQVVITSGLNVIYMVIMNTLSNPIPHDAALGQERTGSYHIIPVPTNNPV